MISLSDTPRLQYYDVQTLEYRYTSKLPMKNERIWSYVKETTSHLQNKEHTSRGRHKVFNKVGLFKTHISINKYTREKKILNYLPFYILESKYPDVKRSIKNLISFRNSYTYITFQIFERNHIHSCTSTGSVVQLCKVSFKSNEPFRRSYAYKPISPYRTYFRV